MASLFVYAGYSDSTITIRMGHREVRSLRAYQNLRCKTSRFQLVRMFDGSKKEGMNRKTFSKYFSFITRRVENKFNGWCPLDLHWHLMDEACRILTFSPCLHVFRNLRRIDTELSFSDSCSLRTSLVKTLRNTKSILTTSTKFSGSGTMKSRLSYVIIAQPTNASLGRLTRFW